MDRRDCAIGGSESPKASSSSPLHKPPFPPCRGRETGSFDLLLHSLLSVDVKEGVGDLLGAVERGDKHEQSAAGDDEAEGTGRGVVVVVWEG